MCQTDFSLTILAAESTAAVLVAGELDLATAPELDHALATCLEAGYEVIDVDMLAVTFLACAGLNVLLAARRTAASTGRVLQVVHPSGVVERLLRLTSTTRLLPQQGEQDLPWLSVG